MTNTLSSPRRVPGVGRLSSFVLATALLSGCGGVEPVSPVEEAPLSVGTLEDSLYLNNGATLWTQNQRQVPICFTTAGFAQERQWIKESLENTWMRVSPLNFTGFGDCPTTGTQRFVRINIVAAASGAGSGGNAGYGMGMHRLPTDAPSVNLSIDPTRSQGRVEYLAVHELGHVLGFFHEQARPDNPDDRHADPAYCRTVGETETNGTYESAYDRDSIMHYCNRGGNSVGYISATDIIGVRNVYGAKASGSFTSFDGRCLDVPWGSDFNGNPLQVFDCGSGNTWSTQQFMMNPATGVITWLGSSRVLDVRDGLTTPGTVVQIHDVNGSSAQQWSMPNAAIKGIGGLCLDIEGGVITNGARVQLSECNGGATQKFTWGSDKTLRIRNPSTGVDKCVDVFNAETANETPVILWDCLPGESNQKWAQSIYGGFGAYNSTFNKCLDAHVPVINQFKGQNGEAKLQIFSCNGGQNQRFSLHGEVRGLGNNCLEVSGGARQNGTPAVMNSCNGGARQKWEYNL